MEMISIDNACRPFRTRSVTRRDETSGDALEEYKDAILSTSTVGECVEDTRSGKEVDEVNILLEEDVMRVQVASVSGEYDPDIFCKIINEPQWPICKCTSITDEVNGVTKVPIVDAVIAYDCPQYGQTYLLVVRNAYL